MHTHRDKTRTICSHVQSCKASLYTQSHWVLRTCSRAPRILEVLSLTSSPAQTQRGTLTQVPNCTEMHTHAHAVHLNARLQTHSCTDEKARCSEPCTHAQSCRSTSNHKHVRHTCAFGSQCVLTSSSLETSPWPPRIIQSGSAYRGTHVRTDSPM